MNLLFTSRLAAHSEIRQVEASRLADAAADAVDQVFAREWRRIVRSLNTPLVGHARDQALRGLLRILPAARSSIDQGLRRIAEWGHRSARRNLQTTLPLRYLQSAAVSIFQESLLEDVTSPAGRAPSPGTLELILRNMGKGEEAGLEATTNFAFAVFGDDPAVRKQAFMDMLFPPPPKATVDEIVYAKVNGLTWLQRLEHATRTSATPQRLAETVAQGVAAGDTQQQIARRLLPVVDGVRSTARRIARTEGLRVAQEIQVRAWDGLGEMLQGYQIRAVLDERTREEHRLRNGTIYYKDPKPGQHGLEECPRPPLEADGTIAWNCRCTLSPVLAPPDYLDASALKLFRDNESMLVPDPATYSDWFAGAGPRARRVAVGTRRYAAAREVIGSEPGYEIFVDPDDDAGGLMSIDRLRNEGAFERTKRINRVRSLIDQRRKLIRNVNLLGLFN